MTELSEIYKKYNWVFFGVLILTGTYLTSLYNFLLFHSLAELFSIVIAFGIFIVAWHSRRFLDNNYLLFLGIAYLFVGIIDVVHTLAYKGMGVFQGYDANLPTKLWIVARYVESLSLFIAPFFFNRKLRVNAVFLVYTVAISLLLGTIFYGSIFPDCFIEGKGLTPFKKISEYIISLILLASMALLIRKRMEFDKPVLIWVVWSIIATIISELAFTFYISVYGFSNLVGHIFKITSFYLIYKAIIETGLTKPYNLLWRGLKLSEETLREERDRAQDYLDVAGVMLLMIGPDQKVHLINKKGCEVLGYGEKEIVGKNWFDHFLPERVRENVKSIFSKMISGEMESFEYVENVILTKRGQERMIVWHNTVLRDEAGNVAATLSSGEDITERRKAEEIIQIRMRLFEFAANHNLEELLTKTLDEVEELTKSKIGFYHFIMPDQETLSLQAWSTRTMNEFCKAEGQGLHYKVSEAGVWVDCVYQKIPVIHNDYESLPHKKGMPEGHAQVIRELVVPIIRKEKIVAILGVGNKPTDYTDKDVEIVSYLADVAWEIADNKRKEESIKESTRKFNTMIDNLSGVVYRSANDPDWTMEYISDAVFNFTGYPSSDFLNSNVRTFNSIIHQEDQTRIWDEVQNALSRRVPYTLEYRIVTANNEIKWVWERGRGVFDNDKLLALEGFITDITERKRIEEEREKLIGQLQEALAKVKTLSGILPICSSCKKVRDDKGYWTQVEAYIRDHSEAEFSHGICPDCMKKLYGNYLNKLPK